MLLEYPGHFDTTTFPAGKRIAVSRAFGIAILTSFFLIICTCALLVWGVSSMQTEPFVISVDKSSGKWDVIKRSGTQRPSYPNYVTAQEAVVGNFVQSWFHISSIVTENEAVWRNCPVEECTGGETLPYGERACAISCSAIDTLYNRFVEEVMPDYRLRGAEGETWGVVVDSMNITSVGAPTETGGMWRINATVWSNINASFQIVAFARVALRAGGYPMAMGFYVSEFNAYRLN